MTLVPTWLWSGDGQQVGPLGASALRRFAPRLVRRDLQDDPTVVGQTNVRMIVSDLENQVDLVVPGPLGIALGRFTRGTSGCPLSGSEIAEALDNSF